MFLLTPKKKKKKKKKNKSRARGYILFHSCHVQCRYFSHAFTHLFRVLSLSLVTVVDDDENV